MADRRTRLHDAIARIARNRTSGAAEIAAAAARAFARFLPAAGGEAILRSAAIRLVRAQPSMAPVWNLANEILLALESDRAATDGGARAAAEFAARLSSEREAVAAAAAPLVSAGILVAVHSWSSTVTATLLRARKACSRFEVLCSESRPGLEGRKTAACLSRAGLRVRLLPDLSFLDAIADADLFLSGADAVSAFGLVNKIGTHALARRARESGIPVHAPADSSKVLPSLLGARLRDRGGPTAEVWPRSPRGVRVGNPTFDTTPLGLLSSIVGPSGAVAPFARIAEAERRPVARALLLSTPPRNAAARGRG